MLTDTQIITLTSMIKSHGFNLSMSPNEIYDVIDRMPKKVYRSWTADVKNHTIRTDFGRSVLKIIIDRLMEECEGTESIAMESSINSVLEFIGVPLCMIVGTKIRANKKGRVSNRMVGDLRDILGGKYKRKDGQDLILPIESCDKNGTYIGMRSNIKLVPNVKSCDIPVLVRAGIRVGGDGHDGARIFTGEAKRVSTIDSEIHELIKLSQPNAIAAEHVNDYRKEIINTAQANWTEEQYNQYRELQHIQGRLHELLGYPYFHIDHAYSIFEHGVDAHQPANMYLLLAPSNLAKGALSCERLTFDEQHQHVVGTFELVTKLPIHATDVFAALTKIMDDLEDWFITTISYH